jgi:exopolyphosphatase / guanosine-5'-triphosphate,3'-diphosphate pyrophosphatase
MCDWNKMKNNEIADRIVVSSPIAVIDIGCTFLRLIIAEKRKEGLCTILEQVIQSVPIGKDILSAKEVSQETLEHCVSILRDFQRLLGEYRISLKAVHAVVIAAMRQAENCDVFLDRLTIASGVSFQLLDIGQAAYYYHLALRMIPSNKSISETDSIAVLEIGGLTCSVLYRDQGEIQYAQTYNIGTLRIRQQLESLRLGNRHLVDIVQGRARETIENLKQNIQSKKTKFIFLGRVLRLAVAHLHKTGESKVEAARIVSIQVPKIEALVKEVRNQSVDELASGWKIPYADAELIAPTLLLFLLMVKALKCEHVFIGNLSSSDGLLIEAADNPEREALMLRHIIRIARETGEKYACDVKHAETVMDYAIALFDVLQKEHACTPKHRMMLQVSALLHDIGMFINARGHHKHSNYLIRNTEFIGLSQEDITVIALIARYHRKSPPRLTHPEFAALPREQRLVICKLSAILRVADALDRVHDQNLGNLKFKLAERELTCIPVRGKTVHAEQIALGEKGDLFKLMYGRTCVIKGS